MEQRTDPHFLVISAVPVVLLGTAVVETLFRPEPGGSYAVLTLVLVSPVLVAWLIWRLRRWT